MAIGGPRPARPTSRRAARRKRNGRGGRPRVEFQHVNIGNPQCVIEVGDEVERLDLGALGPPIERSELFPEPNQRRVHPDRRLDGCGRGSSSAGWGRRFRPGRARAAPRSRRCCGGAASPVTVELDGGELEVEVTDELDVTLVGNASRVYIGELDLRFVERLAEETR